MDFSMNQLPSNIQTELLQLAHQLADRSGEIIRQYFRTQMTVVDKADQTPVSIADREVEQALWRRSARKTAFWVKSSVMMFPKTA